MLKWHPGLAVSRTLLDASHKSNTSRKIFAFEFQFSNFRFQFFLLPFLSVLGIMCKKCTPSVSPVVLCDHPSQITEVNCDDEAALAPGVTFDACTSGKVVASAGTTFVYECTVKVS